MRVTKYANIPFDELIRFAEASNDELATELYQRVELEIECLRELSETQAYNAGYADGRQEILDHIVDTLCPECLQIVDEWS